MVQRLAEADPHPAAERLLDAEQHLSVAEYEVERALERVAHLRVYREYLDELRRAKVLIGRFRRRIPTTIAA